MNNLFKPEGQNAGLVIILPNTTNELWEITKQAIQENNTHSDSIRHAMDEI